MTPKALRRRQQQRQQLNAPRMRFDRDAAPDPVPAER